MKSYLLVNNDNIKMSSLTLAEKILGANCSCCIGNAWVDPIQNVMIQLQKVVWIEGTSFFKVKVYQPTISK